MRNDKGSIAASTMGRRQFGEWREVRFLRKTGQALTYLVSREGDQSAELFVLKLLKDRNRLGRFRREVAAGLALAHPNLVRVIESNLDEREPFIVSEFCTRGHLTVDNTGGMTLTERLTLFSGICEGIAYAHRQGVVHRDVKPDNVFLKEDGTPVVGDFGLCFLDDGERHTEVGEAVGARWYMAPELASGRAREISPACDVYSLGKLLYWLLAGRVFDRERHREREWDLNPQQDPSLALVYDFLDLMINSEASERLRDGGAVLKALRALIRRVEGLQRLYELAGAAGSSQTPGLRVTTFRTGSVVSIHVFPDFGGATTGFGVSGNTLGVWRQLPPEPGETRERIEIGLERGGGPLISLCSIRPGRICRTQGRPFSAIAFNANRDPIVASVEETEGSTSLSVLHLAESGGLTDVKIATDVAPPRYLGIAGGPGGELAVYLGAATAGRSSEVFFHHSDRTERTALPHNTDFPGPLAFSADGTLHHAYVIAGVTAGREVRSLVHRWREPDGRWVDEIVAQAAPGPASASIDLAITGDGAPVILSNWVGSDAPPSLACHRKRSGAWEFGLIDLTPFLTEFGFTGIDAGASKKVCAGADGGMHVVVESQVRGQGYVFFVAIDGDFVPREHRVFPVLTFNGFGIDDLGNAFIASSRP